MQLYPKIIVPKSHGNISKYVDTLTILSKQKFSDSQMTFDPTSVEVTCATQPKDQCVQAWSKSHGNASKYVDTVTIFFKTLAKIPLTTYKYDITYRKSDSFWIKRQ